MSNLHKDFNKAKHRGSEVLNDICFLTLILYFNKMDIPVIEHLGSC